MAGIVMHDRRLIFAPANGQGGVIMSKLKMILPCQHLNLNPLSVYFTCLLGLISRCYACTLLSM